MPGISVRKEAALMEKDNIEGNICSALLFTALMVAGHIRIPFPLLPVTLQPFI